jgi:hypothetical protein
MITKFQIMHFQNYTTNWNITVGSCFIDFHLEIGICESAMQTYVYITMLLEPQEPV